MTNHRQPPPLHCPYCSVYTGPFVSVTQMHVAYQHPEEPIPTPESIVKAAGKGRA